MHSHGWADPGKPWQNGSNESFDGKFRDECLSMQWFKHRIDAKILIEEFRRPFNEVRKTDNINNQPSSSHFFKGNMAR